MDPELANNQEIKDALAKFEAQQSGVKAPPSNGSEVVDILHSQHVQVATPDNVSKMALWVMKYSGGLVKSENVANYVLLIFVVIAMSISFYLFFGGKKNNIPLPVQRNMMIPNPTQKVKIP